MCTPSYIFLFCDASQRLRFNGKIIIYQLADQKKKHCEWLYVTHSAAIEEEVVSTVYFFITNVRVILVNY